MKKVLGIVMVLMMAIGLTVPVFASADDMKSPATGVLMSAVIDNMWVNCADGKTLTVLEVGKIWSKVQDDLTGNTVCVANDYISRI